MSNSVPQCDKILLIQLPDPGWRGGGGSTPYSGLYGEALPERGAFFKLAVY